MTVYPFVHRHRLLVTAGLVVLLVVIGASALSAAPGDEFKKLPGYVDFEAMGVLKDVETSVEVFLKGPLLKLCREAVRNDEPELAEMLDGVQYVRVQVFPLDRRSSEEVSRKTGEIAKNLEKKGWEVAVRVRERDENVFVYILPGKDDKIEGLVVMAVEDGEEAAFINIVGTIDPEQLGRVGRNLDIDDLDDIRWRMNFLYDDEKDLRLVLNRRVRITGDRTVEVRVR